MSGYLHQPQPRRRLRACVEAWPDCSTGDYHPSCCRFPKSCSCTAYSDEHVTDADLEEPTMPDPPGDYAPGIWPRAFVLQRNEDETGVSGTGIVAEGVEFSDGTVALRWTSAWPTSVVFHDRGIDSVVHVHGHGGKTQVVWL